MEYIIYKCENPDDEFLKEEIAFTVWRPSLFSLFPKGYPKIYALFSLFKFFGFFVNENYAIITGIKNGKKICSLMIVPKYFKWPFMGNKDVQFMYVITKSEFRGQGMASKMITFAKAWLKENSFSGEIWYVTDTKNLASQRLAEKSGFRQIGKGQKVKRCFHQKLIMK